MPLYEYNCRACRENFEALVRSGRESETRCPRCGSPDLRKLLSAFGIGSGSSRLKAASTGCSHCSGKSCSTCK